MVRGLIPVGAVGWRGCAQGLVRKGTGWWVEPGLSPFLFWQGSFRSLMESPPERLGRKEGSERRFWEKPVGQLPVCTRHHPSLLLVLPAYRCGNRLRSDDSLKGPELESD